MRRRRNTAYPLSFAALCSMLAWSGVSALVSAIPHQTTEFSPVSLATGMPFEISLQLSNPTGGGLPSLHSFSSAEYDGKWLLVGGRTNGLHSLEIFNPDSFSPESRNDSLWVIDPATGQAWNKPLEEAGLSASDVDFLSTTNAQFEQRDDRLYVVGGYGYVTETDGFKTFGRLAAIDVPSVVDWVTGAQADLPANAIRTLESDVLTVTGGVMERIGDRYLLAMGQDFQGVYSHFTEGVYTNQIRSFTIEDDGDALALGEFTASEANPELRRRDLNVIPAMRPSSDGGEPEQGLTALSGVFTLFDGAWTVPVEIDADGIPTTADPASSAAFKQAMNNYSTAHLEFFSESSGEMHSVLFGGISLHSIDEATGEMIRDDQLPFINDVTDVVRNADGEYVQLALPTKFPEVLDIDGNPMLFGTNAEFLPAAGLPTYENGVIKLDELAESTLLGYIYGGITSNAGNGGTKVASNLAFEVYYHPTPEPQSFTLLLGLIAVALAVGGTALLLPRRRDLDAAPQSSTR